MIGDGNMSFSLGLRRHVGTNAQIIATCYPSASELLDTYLYCGSIICSLKSADVPFLDGVDAANLSRTLSPR